MGTIIKIVFSVLSNIKTFVNNKVVKNNGTSGTTALLMLLAIFISVTGYMIYSKYTNTIKENNDLKHNIAVSETVIQKNQQAIEDLEHATEVNTDIEAATNHKNKETDNNYQVVLDKYSSAIIKTKPAIIEKPIKVEVTETVVTEKPHSVKVTHTVKKQDKVIVIDKKKDKELAEASINTIWDAYNLAVTDN